MGVYKSVDWGEEVALLPLVSFEFGLLVGYSHWLIEIFYGPFQQEALDNNGFWKIIN